MSGGKFLIFSNLVHFPVYFVAGDGDGGHGDEESKGEQV